MKRILLLTVLLAAVSLNAQVVAPAKLSAPAVVAVVPSNAPVGNLALNIDGTVTVIPPDALDFISPKYRSLVLFLVAVFAVPLIKAATAKAAGGTLTQALSGAFTDKHVQVANEISQLKTRTGLPSTPAPAAPTPPAAPPSPPLPPLAAIPPVGSLPVILPTKPVPPTNP